MSEYLKLNVQGERRWGRGGKGTEVSRSARTLLTAGVTAARDDGAATKAGDSREFFRAENMKKETGSVYFGAVVGSSPCCDVP